MSVFSVYFFNSCGTVARTALASRGKICNVFAEKIIMLGHGITIHSFYHYHSLFVSYMI